jgi:peptide deformylase
MILPIYTYGDEILKKQCYDVDLNNKDEINILINNMFETLKSADGLGLAAPQIGKSLNLFVIDISSEYDFFSFKEVFINPKILDKSQEKECNMEGCLSVPDVKEKIDRHSCVKLEYYDGNFVKQVKEFKGLQSVVIQHEFDHLYGILFISRIHPIRRKLLNNKLTKISNKKFKVNYKVTKKEKIKNESVCYFDNK